MRLQHLYGVPFILLRSYNDCKKLSWPKLRSLGAFTTPIGIFMTKENKTDLKNEICKQL